MKYEVLLEIELIAIKLMYLLKQTTVYHFNFDSHNTD